MANKIIEVQNITKKFTKKYSFLFKSKIIKEIDALKNVSFDVEEGEIFGLLGPNGAGKTTLVRCLATLLIPDSGSAKILGYDLIKQEKKIREFIGILFGVQSGLYPKLTVIENLKYFGNLYGVDKRKLIQTIDSLLDLLQIKDEMHTLIEKLSTGMKQKINLARVLLKNPKILFLDEPTIGLDPHISKIIRQFIKDELVKKRKMTILLTTHYMYEAEFLCDRVAFINNGQISICGSIPHIMSSLPYDQKLIISTREKLNSNIINEFLNQDSDGIFKHTKLMNVENDGHIEIHIEGKNLDNNLPKIMQLLKMEVEKIELKKPNLEDAFIYYTGTKIDI